MKIAQATVRLALLGGADPIWQPLLASKEMALTSQASMLHKIEWCHQYEVYQFTIRSSKNGSNKSVDLMTMGSDTHNSYHGCTSSTRNNGQESSSKTAARSRHSAHS